LTLPYDSLKSGVFIAMEWQGDDELFQLMRRELYTAIVGDMLDLRGRRHQFLPARCRPLRTNMVVAGRAMTILEADVFHEPDPPFGLMLEALDSLQRNEIYTAAGCSARYALWGELMTTAARARGATGAVLAGYTRDTRGIVAMDFPVFCYGSYAQDQRGRGQVIAYRVPIEINGVCVRTGDVLFGDFDGVLVVPREVETEVISEALDRARKEKTAKQELASGRLATDVFRKYGIL
jgi:regulator of RNase E activity RraA